MTAPRDPQLLFLLGVNLVILGVGAAVSQAAFIDPYNLQSMAAQLPELGLLALGVMLAMSAGNGGIDLSGIALANLSGVAAAVLLGPWIAADTQPAAYTAAFIGVALAVGLAGGVLNGVLIARLGLTPILCTLGTQLLFVGAAVVLSDGASVRVGSTDWISELGNGLWLGVPITFVVFVAICLVLGLVLRHSPFGTRLFLMGTNPKAARYAGFAQARMLIVTYGLCGVLAAVAGVLIASRNVNVKWDYGQSYLLIAILIAVMAGVRPEGGYGRVICLFLSAMALQLLSSMLNFMDVSNFFRDLAWGALLLIFLASGRLHQLGLLRLRPASPSTPRPPPASASSS